MHLFNKSPRIPFQPLGWLKSNYGLQIYSSLLTRSDKDVELWSPHPWHHFICKDLASWNFNSPASTIWISQNLIESVHLHKLTQLVMPPRARCRSKQQQFNQWTHLTRQVLNTFPIFAQDAAEAQIHLRTETAYKKVRAYFYRRPSRTAEDHLVTYLTMKTSCVRRSQPTGMLQTFLGGLCHRGTEAQWLQSLWVVCNVGEFSRVVLY